MFISLHAQKKKPPYDREANVLKVIVVVLLNYIAILNFLHYIIFTNFSGLLFFWLSLNLNLYFFICQ